MSMEDRFVGCLLAGACGDALGAAVEFETEPTIFANYGPSGIRDFDDANGIRGSFTDDTQMTLFTAEGLLSAVLAFLPLNDDLSAFRAEDALPALHQSYLRWLSTQKGCSKSPLFELVKEKGSLVHEKRLHRRRSPGMTCLMSLKCGAVGTDQNKINDSKGCGGVMRVAPCALIVHSAFGFLSADEKAELAFKLGCLSAAITHTHPSGWLSSGSQAAIIARLLHGDCLKDAIAHAVRLLEKEPNNEETLSRINQAQQLATEYLQNTKLSQLGDSEKQILVLTHIHQLGRGFVGEEALAIALYTALITNNNVEAAICYAVNHEGDSDSTGAIVGNIVGAVGGVAAIPKRWAVSVEMRELIEAVSEDLMKVADARERDQLVRKYPPAITVYEGQELYKGTMWEPPRLVYNSDHIEIGLWEKI
ncbi:hypothetical protein O6H91_14G026000 [Diphasiastrum complanatum]|uniref:Uncharacterized protein n=1 Tax=Diphasiastrum complanatum TaxID=34168 RepID=A0ACC2BMH1_DIPCM|nr:hypothetical protein O6H91_14G026000 [Diphasiastrum complanatum]